MIRFQFQTNSNPNPTCSNTPSAATLLRLKFVFLLLLEGVDSLRCSSTPSAAESGYPCSTFRSSNCPLRRPWLCMILGTNTVWRRSHNPRRCSPLYPTLHTYTCSAINQNRSDLAAEIRAAQQQYVLVEELARYTCMIILLACPCRGGGQERGHDQESDQHSRGVHSAAS